MFESKYAKVAKLFAKHIKLSESVDMLQKTRSVKPSSLFSHADQS